jgi:hypothetical protein
MPSQRSLVVGFAGFASILMILIGIFAFFAGLVGILHDEIYNTPKDYIFDLGVVGWGIIFMVLGAALVAAGFMQVFGFVWARAIGVALAVVLAVSNFLNIPYYPFWSLIMVALNIGVIWALTMHGREIMGDDA